MSDSQSIVRLKYKEFEVTIQDDSKFAETLEPLAQATMARLIQQCEPQMTTVKIQ